MALIRHICHGTLILTFFILKTARTASRLASTASRWGQGGTCWILLLRFYPFLLEQEGFALLVRLLPPGLSIERPGREYGSWRCRWIFHGASVSKLLQRSPFPVGRRDQAVPVVRPPLLRPLRVELNG